MLYAFQNQMETVVEISDSNFPLTYRGNLIAKHESPNQKWIIIEHIDHGEMLFIDGQHQSSLMDEHYYHESFVHSLMTGLSDPKKVLILGGAEGCLAREVLRYTSVETVHQVDWDESLVEHFKSPSGIHWNNGAYADPRLHVFCEEALGWLEKCNETYNAIFVDLLDPSKTNLPFLQNILKHCRKKLHYKGGLAVNAGLVNKESKGKTFACDLAVYMREEFREGFQRVALKKYVPSYLGEWGFLMIVPKIWSNLIHSRMILKGLQDFSKDILIHNLMWSVSYPSELRNFWKDENMLDGDLPESADKKLAVADASSNTRTITDYYGC